MLLTERYSNDSHGILTCYDRILIHGGFARLEQSQNGSTENRSQPVKNYDETAA